MNIKNLIKTFITLTIIFIIYNIIFGYCNFQKVYNSSKDKKLANRIEKKLEAMASEVKNTKKTLHIAINELTEGRKIEKICIIGPYNPNINKVMKVNWKQSNLWKSNVVNDDSLFSIFLIDQNNVIPVKIQLTKLKLEGQTCIENNKNDIVFDIYNKNYKAYLHINDKNN